eukprot:CAMPEP_0174842446 /NCGR_PEP_ID=MMETSP1114-20130205/9917_1 /TAXON_ID=312471 /ORGANISM="Neobodo designis, Strain CCAP 1951/1" /LENGTH=314 /DNA_ID=CAMNT_0016076649 /DNA_START=24 /DNA_END=968 /DNA_ORIENTATION=-
MSRRTRASKAGPQVPDFDKASAENRQFAQEMLTHQVDPETLRAYQRMHQRIIEVGGDDELNGMLTFLRTDSQTAAVTKRYYKSALLFIRDTQGRPVDSATSALYDKVLRGMEVSEGRRTPRGAMTPEQFGQLLDHAKVLRGNTALPYEQRSKESKLFEWLHVQFGLAARGPSTMPAIAVEHVDFTTMTVLLHRKATAIERLVGPEHTAVPIWTEECHDFLRARVDALRAAGHAPCTALYPDWDAKVVSAAIQHVAEVNDWPGNVSWTGSHNVRHTAAVHTLEDALEEVRERAGWRTREMARHYSVIRREARKGS